MANLKTLLPQITVPPVTTTVLGSSQQLGATGAYFIDGAYDITLPPVGSFSKGDIIDLIPKEGFVSKAIGDTATEIITELGVADEIVFDKARQVRFVNDGTHNGSLNNGF